MTFTVDKYVKHTAEVTTEGHPSGGWRVDAFRSGECHQSGDLCRPNYGGFSIQMLAVNGSPWNFNLSIAYTCYGELKLPLGQSFGKRIRGKFPFHGSADSVEANIGSAKSSPI